MNRHLPVLTRCTGHCCRKIVIPVSPKQLVENQDRYIDGKQLAHMLEYQGENDKEGFYDYTCKNWDSNTGDCMDYENRPDMCRAYPYGRQCTQKICTDPVAMLPPVLR